MRKGQAAKEARATNTVSSKAYLYNLISSEEGALEAAREGN